MVARYIAQLTALSWKKLLRIYRNFLQCGSDYGTFPFQCGQCGRGDVRKSLLFLDFKEHAVGVTALTAQVTRNGKYQ